ncbi:MAG TPA: ComEC/Rec2 family competence protein [Alphaproteobacteria bacterium]|nr:ComEC/Rec2 family competence protein [Alphaproteobacteria bacterium]
MTEHAAASPDTSRESRTAEWLRRAGQSFRAERERWPLWLPAFLGGGVALYFSLTFEPSHGLGAVVALLALALAALGRRHTGVLVVCLPLAATALGFTAAALRTDRVAAPRIEHRLGPVMLTGRVVEVERLDRGCRLTLDSLVIDRLAPERTPTRVRVRVRGNTPLRPGDTVRLRAVLLPPAEPVAPGAFDFQRHAYFLRLGAVGYAYGAPAVTPARPGGLALRLAALRDAIAARVTAELPGAEGGIAAALMTGERGAIPPDVVDSMRDSGLAHLLAIAGLHLGLVTGALFFGVRALLALIPRIALRYPTKKWAAGAALIGALFYLLITGATVPTQRAFIMTSVVLLGVMIDRTAISMRLVAWAAVAILLIQPESLLGPSFQLSFAAVVALVAAYEALRVRVLGWTQGEGLGRLVTRYLAGIAFTSLVTGLATIPYSLYHFDRLAAYGVVTNLIAVPITALWVLPWAIIAFVLMPFGLESVALAPMSWGLHIVIWSAKTVTSWPGSVAILPAMPSWGLALVSLGGLWLCLWQRPWRWAGLAGIALGLASLALTHQPDIIAADGGRFMAVRDDNGQMLVSPRRGSGFEVDTVLRRAGQTERVSWPRAGASADGRLSCDGPDCLYQTKGYRVALVQDEDKLSALCRDATVVVSAVPVRRRCRAAQIVIDRFDLWREGAFALWLEPGRVRVESVRDSRGDRPWAPAKRPRWATAQ